MSPLAALGKLLILAGSLALASATTIGPAPPPIQPEMRAVPGNLDRDLIRIGLLRDAEEIEVKGISSLILFDMTTGLRRAFPTGKSLWIRSPEPGRLEAAPAAGGVLALSGIIRISPEKPEGRVIAGGKAYRGSLLLKASERGVSAVNELGLEEYLYGVLPLEMSPEWPLEALKAQAVIARSYAVFNLGRFGPEGFDLSSDTRSQIYDGSAPEDPLTSRAVNETEGMVLAYHGVILNSYFHSCCGGHTASVATIWGSGPDPYRPFQGVRDSFCATSPHFRWKVHLEGGEILKGLQRGGLMVTRFEGLSIAQRDRSGYIRTISVTTDQGKELVRANLLRQWLGNSHIKSTHWTRLSRNHDGYLIEGRGYGHGVGLCQWGARAQARKGRDYKRILQFYYPGTVLRQLAD